MKVEDMFAYGITPKEGPNAGKRYRVLQVQPDRAIVTDWKKDKSSKDMVFEGGTYEIWQPPKTLLDGGDVEPTWGNLKKAMEGLPDSTRFYHDSFPFGLSEPRWALRNFSNGEKGIVIS